MIFNMGGAPDPASRMPAFTYTGSYELIDDGKVNNKQNWRLKLKTSGTLTFQRIATPIDIFCVGGGGGAKLYGGGGGYTKTGTNQSVKAGQAYTITIGSGGSMGVRGGTSSFGSLLSAEGGYAGYSNGTTGGNGGSGGGDFGNQGKAGNGGSNGSDGTTGQSQYHDGGAWVWRNSNHQGKGQGTTTREFGSSSGTLYAGGGGGGNSKKDHNTGGYGGSGGGGQGACRGSGSSAAATAGTVNTGGGGGGGNVDGAESMPGGSGIIVIRNYR